MARFSSTQLIVLCTLAGCNFLSAIIFSLQAPFFPAEAERQGASTTFAGLVLGIYEIAGFIACPFISSTILPKFGSYACFHIGMLLAGTTTLLFGFLNRVTGTTTFVVLALVLRVLEAFGAATTFVSSYGFLNVGFSDSMGTAFAVMETCFAVGMAMGPPVGEALYEMANGSESWGFTMPFLTMGIVFYGVTLLTQCTLRPIKDEVEKAQRKKDSPTNDQNGVEQGVGLKIHAKGESLLNFLKVPCIFVFYLACMGVSVCLGFITCTLEPHLRQFDLTHPQVGGVFLIFGGVYACTAWIWGYLGDRIEKPIILTIIGCVLTILSFTFLGPTVFVPMKPSLLLTGVSLAGFGLAAGAIYVSVFILMTNESKRHGFLETATLSGAISALWLSAMHLGSFIGPVAGGALYENFGFGVETLSAVILIGVILILLLLIFAFDSGKSPRPVPTQNGDAEKSEKTPLLLAASSAKA